MSLKRAVIFLMMCGLLLTGCGNETKESNMSENIYILCVFVILLLGIAISIGGILLRKRIRIEFVYLMILGGILFDFVVLFVGSWYGVIFL